MKDDPQLPAPGELIGAKYRVERLLGLGGMGAVYEASHRVTGKRFALKLLLPELTKQHDVVTRFIREAQVAGRFQHPNVVEIYDIGEYGDSFFMVMELLLGESLATRLERDKRLSIEDACEIVDSCLDAVAAAHAAGIIHRDLKPGNIFLCETRTPGEYFPKVLDFGISKLAEQPGVPKITTTDSGTVMGTPFYMAPEQLRSKDVDHRADLYALGVTLYELLSGKQPFIANNYPELVIKIWTESPIPLETLVPEIPPPLAAAVARAMARNVADRFSTAEEMAFALTPFVPPRKRETPAPRPLTATSRIPLPRPAESPPAPKRRTLSVPPDLDTTQRTATPFASESLANPRVRMKRFFLTRRTRWLISACVLVAVGYGVWRELADDELPQVQAASPQEHPQPQAATPAESAVQEKAAAAPIAPPPPAPEAAITPPPAVTPAQEPEEPRTPPPTAARRRSPLPAPVRTDPVLPLQRPSPSINRTQF